MIDTYGRRYFDTFFKHLASKFYSHGFKPLQVTFLALIFGLVGAFCFYVGYEKSSLFLLLLSGLCDVLDGELARLGDLQSPKGALLDIFFDRVVEIAYIFAFYKTASTFSLLCLSCSIILSMTIFLTVGAVSKTKSKKSFFYQAGLMERSEGFIFFALMIIFSMYATIIAYAFAFLVFITAMQRLKEAWGIL